MVPSEPPGMGGLGGSMDFLPRVLAQRRALPDPPGSLSDASVAAPYLIAS